MFEWHQVDESYIQSIKVFTSGVNLPGGVLLRTSRVAPLKHGESVGIAETFIPGVIIKAGELVPLVDKDSVRIVGWPSHRFEVIQSEGKPSFIFELVGSGA